MSGGAVNQQSQEMIQKINDLITIRQSYPQESRGYLALDWAIKNLAIAHDAYVLTGKPMVVDKSWEPGL
jgi:hypothetical protein